MNTQHTATSDSKPDKGSRREERKVEIRQRIIESCLQMMGQKHFQEITIKDICDQAQVARRTLYSYFASKEALLDEVSHSVLYAGTIDSFSDATQLFEGTADRLDAAFGNVGKPMELYQGESIQVFIQLIQNLTLRISANTALLQSFHKAALDFFEACLANEDTRDHLDPHMIADLTVNALVGIIMSWVNDQNYPAQQRINDLKEHIASVILLTPKNTSVNR
ncbi:Uncharacterised protein [BD1-7 clade bacterium]|uniref:HTH tetR-type domain-containing protein n=1 Tax=BD1-7 clade bacterium TaxID=2029982 RepID=A0A5S9QY45_9GAMM|nr:Uncharacterised protein [BD1-7 clade bacterium]